MSYGSYRNPVASLTLSPHPATSGCVEPSKAMAQCWVSCSESSDGETEKRVAKSVLEKWNPQTRHCSVIQLKHIANAALPIYGLDESRGTITSHKNWDWHWVKKNLKSTHLFLWAPWKHAPAHTSSSGFLFYLSFCPGLDTIDLNGPEIQLYCHLSLKWPTQLPTPLCVLTGNCLLV